MELVAGGGVGAQLLVLAAEDVHEVAAARGVGDGVELAVEDEGGDGDLGGELKREATGQRSQTGFGRVVWAETGDGRSFHSGAPVAKNVAGYDITRLLASGIIDQGIFGVSIMMTVITTTAGLMPIMWSHGTGSQVMKRIAAPMVGGMVSATILTLIVVPAIYGLWKGWRLKD